MKILEKIIKITVGLFSIFGSAGYGILVYKLVLKLMENPGPLLYFLAGVISFTIVWMFFTTRQGNFWSTLEHELTHALFATLFLKKINSLSASRKKGGIISIEGGNFVIALSPYFFPLAAMLVLLLKFLVPGQFQTMVIFILGVSYQFHLVNLVKEFHVNQSDLYRTGFLFSLLFILWANILFLGVILSGIEGNWSAPLNFIWDGLKMSLYYMFASLNMMASDFSKFFYF